MARHLETHVALSSTNREEPIYSIKITDLISLSAMTMQAHPTDDALVGMLALNMGLKSLYLSTPGSTVILDVI